jgi:hypothetical protein
MKVIIFLLTSKNVITAPEEQHVAATATTLLGIKEKTARLHHLHNSSFYLP